MIPSQMASSGSPFLPVLSCPCKHRWFFTSVECRNLGNTLRHHTGPRWFYRFVDCPELSISLTPARNKVPEFLRQQHIAHVSFPWAE